jgi:predicted metalloprotease with PDZ domain
MHNGLKAVLAAAALMLCGAQAPAPDAVEYELTPIVRSGALEAVQIDLRFRGEADGETPIRLPESWGGESELWRTIQGLRVVSGGALREGAGPTQRIVTHRPNARLHLRYRIVQDFEGAPSAEQGNTYRPVIQPDYFHLIGEAVFVSPEEGDLNGPLRVRIRNLPRGWTFASDLQHGPLTLDRLWSSVMVGGDFRIVERTDQNVRIAIRGDFAFTDEDFAGEVGNIISAHRRFFGDPASPYLITVIELVTPQPGWRSIGGTGLGDAFAFFATPNAEGMQITRILAHEGLHTWIPREIGGMPAEGEAAHYWFSEGFTDFYTGRILVRDGLWTPQQFADELNQILQAYALSPARDYPNARIAADFWNDQDIERLPYKRGRLLATMWDARLRAEGRDLDDVILEMRRRAQAGDPLKAAELFPVVMQSFGQDISEDIATHVDAGARVMLAEDTFGACGRVVTETVAVFERGFDAGALQNNNLIISGVDPQSNAYAAGLRDGMLFVRRDAGEIGNSQIPITYVVRDGDTERAITYLPAGRTSYERQRLVLADELEGERLAQCRAVLGGG